MRKTIQFFLIVELVLFISSSLLGQNIDFTLRFNPDAAQYEVYGKPDFDDPFFFVGGGNQISLVFPASLTDSPIAIQSVNGGLWLDNSQIYAPASDVDHDFHSIASNGSGVTFVNDEELLLFTFSISQNPCISGSRLFENDSDPQSSDPGMNGGDFNNFFANIFDFQNYYRGNYDNEGSICLTPPSVTPTQLIVPQDSFNSICLPIFDPNPGDTFTTNICSPGSSNGTAIVTGTGDQLCVEYTPFLGFIGTDEVCVTVCDQTGLCTSDTLPIVVISSNCIDTDDDGICDQIDNCISIQNPDQADCDEDGEGDVCEPDSDNDSIPDDCDVCMGNDAMGDTDGDGVCDDIDNCVFIQNPDQADCDNDGEGDFCELDTDGDSVPDDCDVCTGNDAMGDTDGDGVCDDIDNCVFIQNPDQADCDNDGEGDFCELDTDGDLVPDDCDVCTGNDATGDTDGDGICDDVDNCVFIQNPGQEDCDIDGEGNHCEADDDDDGIPNGCDICFGDDNSGDTDEDGICDNVDNCVSTPNPAQVDCDSDGVGDLCGIDSDGDSVPDECDVCQGNDAYGDDDGDGICNAIADCDIYQVNISNDGTECVQPFTDINLMVEILGENINLDLFTFHWTGPDNFSSSNRIAILPNIQNENSGTYTVTVASLQGDCEYVLSTVVDVTIIPTEPQIIASSELVCIGSELVLSIPEYNGTDVHYEWFGPRGTTSSGAYPDQAEIILPDFLENDAGSYQVMVTVDNCSSLLATAVNIQLQPQHTLPTIIGPTEICQGGVISLRTDAMAEEYLWTGPNGFTSDLANPYITISANSQHEGIYQLTISSNGCTSPVSSWEVNLSTPPSTPILATSTTVCDGDDFVLNIVNPTGSSYQWIAPSATVNSDFGILGDSNNVVWTNVPSTSISSSTNSDYYEPGLWRVRALNELGCFSETSIPQPINIISPPEAVLVTSEGDVCENEPVYLHATSLEETTFKWYDGDPAGAPAGTLVATGPDPILFNVDPGLHQYFISAEKDGCVTDTYARVDVMVEEKPILNAIPEITPFCEGATIQLNAPEILGATYHWYGQNGFSSNAQNPIISNATSDIEGTYLLYVTINGCASDPLTTEVVLNSELAVPVAINNGPVCNGSELLLSVTNPNPAFSYEWFNAEGSVSVGFGNNLSFSNVNMDMAGSYYVIASSDACSSDPSQSTSSGENAFTEVEIEVTDSDIAYVGDPIFACDNSVTVNALATTNGTGLWSLLNGGPNTTILQPGQPSSLVVGLQEGINELVWSVTGNSCGNISTDTLLIEWSNTPIAEDDLFEIEYNESLNNLIVFENDIPNTEEFEISITSDVVNGELVLLENNILAYWPDQGFIGTETFTYQICHKYCSDLCDEATVTIRVATEEDCEAASVMTPNGDGYNDAFIITCVLDNPGSELSIFNRWGDEVYFTPDYQNNWEGTHNGRDLPAGTYFYILKLNDHLGSRISGYVYIER